MSTAPKVSFEFFPPKTADMEQKLWDSVQRLAPIRPSFVSVTYGAGGSTRERTHSIVKRMVEETDLSPAGHITCVAATRDEIDGVLQGLLGRRREADRGAARRSDGGDWREV